MMRNAYILGAHIPLMPRKAKKKVRKKKRITGFRPKFLYSKLKEHVVGQDEAMKSLCVLFSRQSRRARGADVPKTNALMYGPPGSGKTLMMQTLCEYCNLPYRRVTATGKSSSGHTGPNFMDSFEDIDPDDGRFMVVHIDEIDKLGLRGERDMEEDLQDEVIAFAEGTEIYDIKTHDMLCVATGAFVDLEEIVRERYSSPVGFTQPKDVPENLLAHATRQDLLEYGFKPEFLARFGRMVHTNPLDERQLRSILDLRKGKLNSMIEYFSYELDIGITFTNGARNYIIAYAMEAGEGARGINSAVDELLENFEFEQEDHCGKSRRIDARYARRILEV